MDLGKLFPTAFHRHRAMNLMRDEHRQWVDTVPAGSVWWTVKSVGEDRAPNVREGQGDSYYQKYTFVKRVKPWPYPMWCWKTDTGRLSWDIWFQLGGTGLTQQRGARRTYPEIMADYEAAFGRDSARMQRQIAEQLEREREQFRAPSYA
jgi:hypothetical protein